MKQISKILEGQVMGINYKVVPWMKPDECVLVSRDQSGVALETALVRFTIPTPDGIRTLPYQAVGLTEEEGEDGESNT